MMASKKDDFDGKIHTLISLFLKKMGYTYI